MGKPVGRNKERSDN